jgi:hypothetical protein
MNEIIYLYLMALAITFASGLRIFRNAEPAIRTIIILVGLTLLVESSGMAAAKIYKGNLQLYYSFSVVHFILVCLYFHQSVAMFRQKKIAIAVMAAGVILFILNLLFLQPFNSLNSNFMLIEAILIIGMCMLSFYRLMVEHEYLSLKRHPHFWITSILLVFWSVTFLNWGLYDTLEATMDKERWKVHFAVIVFDIITYSSICLVFILYKRMRYRHGT